MKFYLLCLTIFFNYLLQAQTFEFPKVTYDDIETHKDGEIVFKKEYKKKDSVVMTAHYPYQKSIQGFCYKQRRIQSDSIIILSGELQGFVDFQKNGNVNSKIWSKGKNIVTINSYFPNKQLRESYKGIPKLGSSNDSPACVREYLKLGEYFQYDKTGKETVYKNYETGVGRTANLSANPQTNKKLEKLRKNADDLVLKSYGKKFFKKYIKPDYLSTTGYYPKSYSYRRNNGLPSPQEYSEGWFQPKPDRITYADFVYKIVMDDDHFFNVVTVRVDSLGEIVYAVNKQGNAMNNMTRGLVKNDSKKKFLTKKEVLALAKKEGLNLDDPDLKVNMKWVADSKGDSYGKLNYQLLSDRCKKSTYGCGFVIYDEWLVDALTGEIKKDGEVQNGECMVLDTYQKQVNGKYGFISPFDEEPIIPYEYEMLPRNMSKCMVAKKGGRYGCINDKNETLIPFEYDQIKTLNFSKKRFKNDFVIVKKGKLFGLFDNKGNEILPVKYNKLEKQSENLIAAYEEEQIVMTYDFKKKKMEKF